MRALRTALLAGLFCLPALAVPAEAQSPYPYEVVLPAGYEAKPRERFPLILFLHGGGGLIPQDNLIPEYAKTRTDFPFLVVTPRGDRGWSVERLDALLKEVEDRYRVDRKRVYVTGLSMGAFGGWSLAAAFPRRFAALALVAGGGDPAEACTLKNVPVWLFHNRADPVVPAARSEELAAALKACGAPQVRVDVFETVEPGLWAHNAWKAAYMGPALYEWLLQHTR